MLLLDDEYHETLIKRVLTKREVSRHFREYDQLAVELARVATVPQAERAAYYVARLEAFDGPVSGEDAEVALRDLGSAAFPALIPMLAVEGRAWQAAKLLADIGQPDDGVVRAMHEALTEREGPDQLWVARALARLGRLDLVLGQIDRLPQQVVVSAVTAPGRGARRGGRRLRHVGRAPPGGRRVRHRPGRHRYMGCAVQDVAARRRARVGDDGGLTALENADAGPVTVVTASPRRRAPARRRSAGPEPSCC
ncbi:hypothetical protein [Micromonospora sp. NPDC005173]|uniref:hypothetical protein n=1 Tax=Micromonospora sp. NPDC005173 TaxID=3157165 RepID=UPI0033B43EF1